MADVKYGNLTFWQILGILLAAKPDTLSTAAKKSADVYKGLDEITGTILKEVDKVVGNSWEGQAADRFHEVIELFVKYLNSVLTRLKTYEALINRAYNGLYWATVVMLILGDTYKKALDRPNDPVPQGLPKGTETERWNELGRQVLVILGQEYQAVIAALKDVPSKFDIAAQLDPKENEKEDPPKSGDENGGEKQTGPGSSDGGGDDPPTSNLPGGPNGGETGPGGDSTGPGTGVPYTGPLTDDHRNLPKAPTATDRDGHEGIDVDGDGQPDLGLSGIPLPGAALVSFGGYRGVDVNGDGKPDIGVDGEILPFAPIVQGSDGTIGIDVNGDGEPDIGISGQVLSDAPIVTQDGVRGIDVNGDGIPDIGMDRKPLPGADLITVDGVTGVDVDGDGKPDIGANGEILKDAPLVTTANGITGVDVNGDGRPDIAITGGINVPVGSVVDGPALPDLPFRLLADAATPGTQTVPPFGAHEVSLTSALLGGSVPTTLTHLAAAVASARPTQPPPVTRSVSGGYGSLPGQFMMGGGLAGAPDRKLESGTILAEDHDAWSDTRGMDSALGAPVEEFTRWDRES